MKKPFLILVLSPAAFFLLFSPASADQWVKCGRTRYSVQERDVFSGFGYDVYYADASKLIFVNDRGRTSACLDIGPGWQMRGFQQVAKQEGSSKNVTVFVIFQAGEFRYFNVTNGKEVLIDSDISLDRHEYSPDQSFEENAEVFITTRGDSSEDLKPSIIAQWTGASSGIHEEKYFRITNSRDWENLWMRHTQGEQPPPKVNFEKNMVLALFLGKQINVNEINLFRIRNRKKWLVVDFSPRLYFSGTEENLSTTPYAIYVLPKNPKQVYFRKNVQSEAGGVPKWIIMGLVK